MRGRTLNDSFIILDEAQNTTPEQMKMFLTRLGFGSKMVVTGDVTQLDLPRGISGLKGVRGILEGIDDIAFCDFTGKDVVRHSLVAAIVAAYDEAGQEGVSHMDIQINYDYRRDELETAAAARSWHAVSCWRGRTSPSTRRCPVSFVTDEAIARAQREVPPQGRARPTCCPSSATA